MADHINYIYNKLIKFVSIFCKIRTKLPSEILRMIYFAVVHSNLLYGIEVYANTTSDHLTKLITLNNKLLHILQHKSSRSHITELYKTYCTLRIYLLHDYQILLFMHKYNITDLNYLLFSGPILMKISTVDSPT